MADCGVPGVPIVILASGSPRRAAILRNIGLEPEIMTADVDESVLADESAEDLVERLALAKLTAGLQALPHPTTHTLIVAADTVVDVGGSILGKPEGKVGAEAMLTMLSGRDHRVITGLAAALIDPDAVDGAPAIAQAWDTTVVSFRSLDRDMIDWYVSTGEPLDKAGAYGIQGRGALLVDRIDGSYLNVVGLPIVALDRLFRRFGWPLQQLTGRSAVGSVS